MDAVAAGIDGHIDAWMAVEKKAELIAGFLFSLGIHNEVRLFRLRFALTFPRPCR